MAESPPLPFPKGRAEVLAKVRRTQDSLELAIARELEGEKACGDVAKRLDEANLKLKAARRAKQPTAALEQAVSGLRHELSVEKEELEILQENRKDALAEFHEAQRERDNYVETVELAGAPARFETVIRASNAVLTAVAVAALTTSFQVEGHKTSLAVAISTSIAALALGLIAYVPSLIAVSLDALRRPTKGGAMSFAVSWHGWIRWMQIGLLATNTALVILAWIFLMVAFLA